MRSRRSRMSSRPSTARSSSSARSPFLTSAGRGTRWLAAAGSLVFTGRSSLAPMCPNHKTRPRLRHRPLQMKSPKLFNLLSIFASLALLGCAGCAALDKGADPIEVRAEQTIQTASDTMDLFIGVEYDNQALIEAKLPAVHQFAEYLREKIPNDVNDASKGATPRGIGLIDSVNQVRRAYKANRTPENKASLAAAVAALQE